MKPQAGQLCLYRLFQLFPLQTGILHRQPCIGLFSFSVSSVVQCKAHRGTYVGPIDYLVRPRFRKPIMPIPVTGIQPYRGIIPALNPLVLQVEMFLRVEACNSVYRLHSPAFQPYPVRCLLGIIMVSAGVVIWSTSGKASSLFN